MAFTAIGSFSMVWAAGLVCLVLLYCSVSSAAMLGRVAGVSRNALYAICLARAWLVALSGGANASRPRPKPG